MKKILVILVLCACFSIKAQNFNYQYSTSSATYTELSSPVYIAQNGNWIQSYSKIPIGFNFSYLGKTFDSVSVFNNGFLVFDNNFNYGFAAFALGVTNQQDSLGNNISSVSYSIEGSSGSRILKIQFKNCGVFDEKNGAVNYQVWISESNNSISILTGSNSYGEGVLTNYPKVVGLINMNMLESNQMALLLSGSSNSPAAASLNKGDSKTRISDFPSSNTMYVFTPNF